MHSCCDIFLTDIIFVYINNDKNYNDDCLLYSALFVASQKNDILIKRITKR